MSRSVIFSITQLDDKYQNLQTFPTFFALAPIDSEILIKCQFLTYLQKVGQCHGVQFSQLHHSMANVKIYKCLPLIFALALTVSEI